MNTLEIVLLALAAAVILAWLGLALRGPPKVETPNPLAVLRYGSVQRIGALLLALAPPTIMIYAIWAFRWRSDGTLAAGGAMFLATCLIAGLLLIETERVQVVLSEEGITRHSPWRGMASLTWAEIERIRYSGANRWFVIEGAGRTMRVSRHLAGVKAFAEAVRTRVERERWASAAGALAAL